MVTKKKPQIGFTVNAKVKRFIKANRTAKTLVSTEFLTAFNEEIRRVVVMSAETVESGICDKLSVPVPKTHCPERLVCDTRIKEKIREIKPKVTISKRFLSDINDYAGGVATVSAGAVEGIIIKQVVVGHAVAKMADKASVKSESVKPRTIVKAKKGVKVIETEADWEPSLERDHVTVGYTLYVQGAVLLCETVVYTGRTTKQVTNSVTAQARSYLDNIGIKDDITIEITSVKRSKYE